MKRTIILLSIIVCLTGCAVQNQTRVVSASFIDYRPYSQSGFFISPDPYPGKFSSLGELYIEVFPAIESSRPTYSIQQDGIYSNVSGTYARNQETIFSDELLEIAVDNARELGANGLADFDIRIIYRTDPKTGKRVDVDHYEISGLCIVIES